MMKLQRAKEQNERLDAENRALRERVRSLESEKKNLLVQVGILMNGFFQKKINVIAAAWDCSFLCLSSWQKMMQRKMLLKMIKRTRA